MKDCALVRLVCLTFASLVLSPAHAQSTTALLTQDFENVDRFPENVDRFGKAEQDANGVYRLALPDWFAKNNSVPRVVDGGGLGQGSPELGFFAAQSGTLSSYVAFDDVAVAYFGDVSVYLVTPRLDFRPGARLEFWFQSANRPGSNFPDRLQVRLSKAADSGIPDVGNNATDVGSFSTLLLDINPNLASAFTSCPQGGFIFNAGGASIPGTIPETWCRVVIEGSALPTSGSGRIAFRYFVQNGGVDGSNGLLVGIDRFSFGDQFFGDRFE